MIEIGFFGDYRTKLGESPIWDADTGYLWWVDAIGQKVQSARADGSPGRSFDFDRPVGSVGLAQGGLIVALSNEFILLDVSTGAHRTLARVPQHDGTMRLNDGKMSRGNHYICGETRLDEDATGSMWRVDAGGGLAQIATGMRISNAICFSPDGDTLYFADSLDGEIRRHDYDSATGAVGARTGTIDVTAFAQAPDGATIDSDGNLWIALVLDQALACVSPNGDLIRRIEMPVPFPACPAFGGEGMDILFVTSIADSERSLVTDHPDGGRIVAIRGLGVTGIPESRFIPEQKPGAGA